MSLFLFLQVQAFFKKVPLYLHVCCVEMIPSSNFRVMTIFKNQRISENFPVL